MSARHSLSQLLWVFPVLLLAGCGSMSGLSGESEYACQAPEGVACDSMSGVYANAMRNNLPSQRPRSGEPKSSAEAHAPTGQRNIAMASAPPPLITPLRSSPRVIRLWFKPWEDADHDLYDQGYVYVQIDNGRWLIDHAAQSTDSGDLPIRLPPSSPSSAPPSETTGHPRQPDPYPPINIPDRLGDSR